MAQTLSGEPAVPGIIPGGVASKDLSVYNQSPSSCLYQRVPSIHTSGLVETSAWMACRPQLSDCGGVCGTGAGVVLLAGNPPSAWIPISPTPWVAWIDGRGRQLLAGQRLSSAACQGGRR